MTGAKLKLAYLLIVIGSGAILAGPHATLANDSKGLLKRLESLEVLASSLKSTAVTVQSGRFSIHDDGGPSLLRNNRCIDDSDNERGIRTGRINFDRPFAGQPNVVVGLARVDLSGGEPSDAVRLTVQVTRRDREGFDFKFVTWCTTKVNSAHAVWIAHGGTFK